LSLAALDCLAAASKTKIRPRRTNDELAKARTVTRQGIRGREDYPDTQLIDVVNEPPPHTMPSYTAALGGAGASGYDWIVQAFKWANQYCPNAILILNDYNNIEYANDNNRTIDIAKRIEAAGAPIHAVAAQAHPCGNLSASTVQMYTRQDLQRRPAWRFTSPNTT
jgi:GH35 family endo-1,4-beta-xylanase